MSNLYQFTWHKSKVVQKKILVSHDDYLEWKSMPSETEEQENEKHKFWNQVTKGMEWFTDKSPYWEAVTTGTLNCNGIHHVTVCLL